MELDDLFRVYEQEITRCRFAKHLPSRYVARLSAYDIDLLASVQFAVSDVLRRKTQLRRTSHLCSRQCRFVNNPDQDSDILICALTGNIHRCGSTRCAQQLTTKEFRFCRRTLTQFPLEFHNGISRFRADGASDDMADSEHGEDDGGHSFAAMDIVSEAEKLLVRNRMPADRRDVSTRAPRTKRMRFGLFKDVRDEKSVLTSPVERQLATGIPQRLPKSCQPISDGLIVAKSHSTTLESDAKHVISRALTAGMKLWATAMNNSNISSTIKPPYNVVEAIASKCIFWWCRVIQCRAFLDNAFSYKFPTHCLVMLSLMVDGFRIDDHVVVEPVDYVRVALPGGNTLKRNLGIKPCLLTNSEKFFRRCIAEWLGKEKSKVEYQIAMNRRLRGSTDELLLIEAPAHQFAALEAPKKT